MMGSSVATHAIERRRFDDLSYIVKHPVVI
jgi:hypothetical protein